MRLNPVEITDKRFFTLVKDYFKSRIEPVVLHNFISKDICDEIIRVNKSKTKSVTLSPIGLKAIPRYEYRNNDSIQNPNLKTSNKHFNPASVGTEVNKAWNLNYTYDWIPEVPVPLYTLYSPGHYCHNHADIVYDRDTKELVRKTRRVSALMYLNSWSPVPKEGCFTGGELIFASLLDEYNQCYMVRPQAGDLILFPSNSNYYHSVAQVTSGERHNIVQWLRFTNEQETD